MGYVALGAIPSFGSPIRNAINANSRIGRNFNSAGPGYAGPGSYIGAQISNQIVSPGIKTRTVPTFHPVIVNDIPGAMPAEFRQDQPGTSSIVTDNLDSGVRSKTVVRKKLNTKIMKVRSGQNAIIQRPNWAADSTNLTFDNEPVVSGSRLVRSTNGIKFSDFVQLDPINIQTPADASGMFESGLFGGNSNMLMWGLAAVAGFFIFSESKSKPKRRRRPAKRRRR